MFLSAALVLAASGVAMAAEHKAPPASAFTNLDSCALLGRGFDVGGGVCLKVTGGVSYTQTFGNAVGGFNNGPGGMPIVTTPAGTYSIPVPAN